MAGKIRLGPKQRRAIIITAAVRLANSEGIGAVTFENVGRECEFPVAAETVRHYFSTRNNLWRAVMLDERASASVREILSGMALAAS